MAFGVGPLVFVRGSMNTEAYCNILDNEILPTLGFFGMDPYYFQDDNARCRVSRAPMQWYADSTVRRLDWPAQRPDLNPIEHFWDELDRRVRAGQVRPKSIAQLMEWLQEEWRRILVDVLQTLVESMPDRVDAVIAARGSSTVVDGFEAVKGYERIVVATGKVYSTKALMCSSAAVAERLARSPLTEAKLVQSPAGSPDFCKWESCRTMPLIGGFSRTSVDLCFTAFGVGPLVFVRDTMNTEAYCNILDNEMLPTLLRFYGMDPCYFQDDSASCHVSRATMQWYADNNVRRLDWSVQSHDLNPIEHLWDELDRRERA
ncbi:hypothetical protein PR048_017024 [Dryococelus australis]|uniref:Transposable element Tcb2 transposase n=1 Tax=Dryococelus australis TaxID=614101 RepID=A0ABQ9H8C5_9NEOP|nr:hypothetical protein PR048_017024 [Dryococelus australis]